MCSLRKERTVSSTAEAASACLSPPSKTNILPVTVYPGKLIEKCFFGNIFGGYLLVLHSLPGLAVNSSSAGAFDRRESVKGLALTNSVLVFLLHRKLHCTRNYIHINLFVAFILKAMAVFIKDVVLYEAGQTDDCLPPVSSVAFCSLSFWQLLRCFTHELRGGRACRIALSFIWSGRRSASCLSDCCQ